MSNFNVEAETSVIGLILQDNNLIYNIVDNLKPEYFYVESNSCIFETAKELILGGQEANPISISEKLKSKDWLDDIGGLSLFKELKDSTSSAIPIQTYSKIIIDAYKKRYVEEAIQEAREEEDVSKSIEKIIDTITKIDEIKEDKKGFKHISSSKSIYDESLKASKSKDKIKGLKTGFNKFDRASSGLQPSKLYILGASTGCGKSTFAFNICKNILEQDKKVAVFSLEMTAEEILGRLVCNHSGLDQEMIQSGLYATKEDFNKIKESEDYLRGLGLFVDETAGLSIEQLKYRALSLHKRECLDLIIIDHMHLLKAKGKDRLSQMGEISMGLKNLAKELNVPILSLAQLNRSFSGRANKRPILSDLRDSGTIEQDSDMVMLLYREEYTITNDLSFGKNTEIYKNALVSMLENKGKTELIIAKNRGGRQDNIKMIFDGSRFNFMELNGLIEKRGLSRDDAEIIEGNLVKVFGSDWIASSEFINLQNKVIALICKHGAEHINNINQQVINNYGDVFNCCSPILTACIGLRSN